jgi:ADP-ribose pyrophosphatase YjhB (NUDIX family)
MALQKLGDILNTNMPTDYSHAKSAPVIIIFVKYRDKFLLVKRSTKMLTYQGLWSCLAGFVDDDKTMEEKVKFEIEEELGLNQSDIKEIKKSDTYLFVDDALDREWIRHLYLVEITNPNIKLSWEHSELVWTTPEESKTYETTPGLHEDFQKILALP